MYLASQVMLQHYKGNTEMKKRSLYHTHSDLPRLSPKETNFSPL